MIDLHPRPRELIAASLDRRLSADERAEVQRHLTGCAACRALERDLRADAAALSVPTRIAPPTRIRTEIERQVTIPALDPSLVRVLRLGLAVAVLMLVIVVVAIGLAVLEPRPTTPA